MFEELKKRRIELGKSIEEVSQWTKIKKSYIQAIEDGNFKELPLEIYTKSYIKIYSELLGIEPQKFIDQYENFLNTQKSSDKQNIFAIKDKRELIEKTKVESKNYSRWIVSGIITLIVFLLILVVIYLERKDDYIPPPPSLPLKTQIEPEVQQKKELNKEEKLTPNYLKIEATDKVWMRITIDDKEKKEYLLNPGQSINLEALKSFKLHIGNAGGVKVYFNNEDLGKLGETGQIVYLKLPKD